MVSLVSFKAGFLMSCHYSTWLSSVHFCCLQAFSPLSLHYSHPHPQAWGYSLMWCLLHMSDRSEMYMNNLISGEKWTDTMRCHFMIFDINVYILGFSFSCIVLNLGECTLPISVKQNLSETLKHVAFPCMQDIYIYLKHHKKIYTEQVLWEHYVMNIFIYTNITYILMFDSMSSGFSYESSAA